VDGQLPRGDNVSDYFGVFHLIQVFISGDDEVPGRRQQYEGNE
jgi:hypothetical protein